MTDKAPKPTKISRSGAQANEIARLLRTDIISGEIPQGEILRQENLAQRFQTSRMPVRDALRILEQEGLVDLQPNRGAQVAILDVEGIREIYEMRAVAEVLALRHAIPELTNSQIEKAEKIRSEAESAGLEQFGVLNKAFHETLYAPCARPRLLSHISSLHDLADRYLRIAAIELDYIDRSNQEHCQLLAACNARDTLKACKLLDQHIISAGEKLFTRLKEASTR
ncbi:GntR family transcriptional regulator [Kiloniella laminariae]|uniref:GntR family transcriptional regulator n=1 Tax=Kiloniella laminariae TaxID=454162 RepID=A0ABT4LFM3_9PROT|nr:GntR family transcriptional regulator [Kiloniella laminariae]MCZ4279898.1 GntR family transcriptional regulator [Kiloniella laminariae]